MYFFWLEMSAQPDPAARLAVCSTKIRNSAGRLYLAAVLVVLGFITNRLNVSITGLEIAAGMHYIPKWTEIAVTGAIIAARLRPLRTGGEVSADLPCGRGSSTAAQSRSLSLREAALSHAGD